MIFKHRMLRALRRFRSGKRADRGLNISDFQDVRPIGNMRGGLVTNKAGRAVFRARYNGQDVKVYEAYSDTHAEFIAAMAATIPDCFPRVLELRGLWVIAEWAEGYPLGEERQELQLRVLKTIQAAPIDRLPSSGFCYWSDYLVPRFQRAAALIDRQVQALHMLNELELNQGPLCVMHPDLSPANLVATNDGHTVSIDNELLCIGTRPLLDLCNSLRPLTKNRRERLAQLWFEQGRLQETEMRALGLAWTVRETGNAFITGRLEKCQSLMEAALRDPAACLPFSPENEKFRVLG